jgi:hypothetical protein
MPPLEGDSGISGVPGVRGTNSAGGDGVFGSASQNAPGRGVVGVSQLATGVEGNSTDGVGVWGLSINNEGVHGISHGPMAGVAGFNDNIDPGGAGVWGESQAFDGVHGVSHSQGHAGISGTNDGGGLAGFFQGRVTVTQSIHANGVDLVGAISQLQTQIKELQLEVDALSSQLAALE